MGCRFCRLCKDVDNPSDRTCTGNFTKTDSHRLCDSEIGRECEGKIGAPPSSCTMSNPTSKSNETWPRPTLISSSASETSCSRRVQIPISFLYENATKLTKNGLATILQPFCRASIHQLGVLFCTHTCSWELSETEVPRGRSFKRTDAGTR
jgi:hypothetical protein